MPRKDILDYGLDEHGQAVVPKFPDKSFAKDRAFEVISKDQGLEFVTQFQHWTMYDYLRALYLLSGGEWNDSPHACHLLGIREMDSNYRRRKRVQGEWNDLIVVLREEWDPELFVYEATIDPGGQKGRAPHREGQLMILSNVHRARVGTGTHGGHTGPVLLLTDVSFFRDKDRDGTPDTSADRTFRRSGEDQGVHVHWSDKKSAQVGTWSTGCTVLHYGRTDAEYQEFINLIKGHAALFGHQKPVTEMPPAGPDLAQYDIDYVVTTSEAFRTPAEILKLERFYLLLENVQSPKTQIRPGVWEQRLDLPFGDTKAASPAQDGPKMMHGDHCSGDEDDLLTVPNQSVQP